MSSQVIINGKCYIGNKIHITNGKVIINGQDQTPDSKEINIQVQGDIGELKIDTCQKCVINGNVTHFLGGSCDIEINGDIIGNLQTGSGDVECGNIGGNIKTGSGDVKCGNVSGGVETGTGDIKYRK